MNRRYFWIFFSGLILVALGIVFLLTQSQDVPFNVIEESISLVAPDQTSHQPSEPLLLILTSIEDVQLMNPWGFPELLAEKISQVDFQKSFVILVLRSHAGGGLVNRVTRQGNEIVITTTDLLIGPGNFALEGWTQPYEVIQVDKDTGFVGEMYFILQRGTQGVAAETTHTIP
jgi:hypothetical protein